MLTTTTAIRPTAFNLIRHVDTSIRLADAHQSRLDRAAFQAKGFTSPKIRHLLNNLGGLDGLNYLEVGVHRGATFIAANYGNSLSSAVAIDNWSEFDDDGGVKSEFLGHCATLLRPDSYRFIEQDCFTVARRQLPAPVNFYFYDGEHSHRSQRLALIHFYPMLDDEFLFVADEYTWKAVRTGTEQAIAELDLDVLFEQELIDGWWNGLFVSVMRKRKR
jgi:protein O-GlcNAc transferase